MELKPNGRLTRDPHGAEIVDERELMGGIRRGDRLAFNELFNSYVPRLSAFAMRNSSLDPAAVEDIVQMTMINAMRNLDSYRGDAALFTWLCAICRNHLVDVSRAALRRPVVQSIDELTPERPYSTVAALSDSRDPLDECEADCIRRSVRRIVNTLPAHYARILELRFGEELPGREIASVLKISEDAAESLLSRARQAFKVAWTGREGSYAERVTQRGSAQMS